MTADAVRELSEEIAACPLACTTDALLERAANKWEARLRAFLAEREAGMIGEMAALREALRTVSVGCAEGGCQRVPAKVRERDGDDGAIAAALSGEAGKLASAVLKEAALERKEEIVLRLGFGKEPSYERFERMRRARRAAVDALLAATGKGER
jgi:hypothetical protein